MSDDSTTQCLLFPGIFRKPIVVQFDQREGSSDGGALLLKSADGRYGLLGELGLPAGPTASREGPCILNVRPSSKRMPIVWKKSPATGSTPTWMGWPD